MFWWYSLIASVRIEPCLCELNIGPKGLWSVMMKTCGDSTKQFRNLQGAKSIAVASRSSCGCLLFAFEVALEAITTGLAESRSSLWASSALIWGSVFTKIFFLTSKYYNSVSFLKSCCRFSKDFRSIGFHLKWILWWVHFFNGAAFWAKVSIKSEFDCVMHKILMRSSLLVGALMKLKLMKLHLFWQDLLAFH